MNQSLQQVAVRGDTHARTHSRHPALIEHATKYEHGTILALLNGWFCVCVEGRVAEMGGGGGWGGGGFCRTRKLNFPFLSDNAGLFTTPLMSRPDVKLPLSPTKHGAEEAPGEL